MLDQKRLLVNSNTYGGQLSEDTFQTVYSVPDVTVLGRCGVHPLQLRVECRDDVVRPPILLLEESHSHGIIGVCRGESGKRFCGSTGEGTLEVC